MNKVLDKRAQIVEAALELFAQQGFDATTVPEIATRAEVGAGTIYRYFSSKEALLNALFQEKISWLHEAFQRDFPQAGDSKSRWIHIIDRLHQMATLDWEGLQFIDTQHYFRLLDQQSIDIHDQLLAFVSQQIVAGQQAKVLKPMEPLLMISITFGAFLGIHKYRHGQRTGLPRDPDQLHEIARQCCWDLIALHAE
ncbi:TetR/AcrR family transcriptional regulator [Paenibacillus kandeliae]|uniref:TetR/AcrR family transcriptional regulator n=1 Tax=Paenibacillus kandeliae TaxID=3231269 RepID=UPI00345AEEC7